MELWYIYQKLIITVISIKIVLEIDTKLLIF